MVFALKFLFFKDSYFDCNRFALIFYFTTMIMPPEKGGRGRKNVRGVSKCKIMLFLKGLHHSKSPMNRICIATIKGSDERTFTHKFIKL